MVDALDVAGMTICLLSIAHATALMPRLSYEYKHDYPFRGFQRAIQTLLFTNNVYRSANPVPEPGYEGVINVNIMSERRNALPGSLEDTNQYHESLM